ncbi:autotransporter outer membrane beta-barrel domain-containing protein [Rhizobium straminoryzae]|uniref:autotransporter outer membrane beta-barrel domain-containing protein n=1 Tax=Rhizobium straminoryzae TaxID=1387186 RepID=UPI00163DBDC8|nr:autotransporter domain-containing protein [Rhizobium straminoryzae]
MTAVLGSMVGTADPAFAGCAVTGDVITIKCGNDGVYVQPQQGDASLRVDGLTISGSDNKIDFFPSDTDPDVFGTLTLSVSNTTINTPDYGGINVAPKVRVDSIDIRLDPTVTIVNNGGFGGLWVRAELGGDITINSGAGITSTGGSPALTATTNDGSVSIVNTGNLSSDSDRGIYADGGHDSTGGELVSVTNSGDVTAYAEAIRMIQYHGDIRAENSGDVTSQTQSAIYAWSDTTGAISVTNSGSAVSTAASADKKAGIRVASEYGNATVVNSGLAQAEAYGVRVSAGTETGGAGFGDITVENRAMGEMVGTSDTGLHLVTINGAVSVTNDGSISGANGVYARTNLGRVDVVNAGTITATAGTGVLLTGDSVTLTNSGTIEASGGGAVSLSGATSRLILRDGSSISGTVSAAGDATLQLDFAGATTLDAALLGDGAQYRGFDTISATGAGLLTMIGTSDYSGLVSLSGGNVVVDGDIRDAAFLVGRGVTLSGTGNVGDLTVADGGAVAPGHSPGTLYVYGDLSFQTGSSYVADLTTTGLSDTIVVSGNVSIASGTTLVVENLRVANPLTTVYQLITATGAVTGSFTALRDPWAFIDLDVNYNPSSVTLGYQRTGTTFADAALGGNARAVAAALDSFGAASSFYDDLLWSQAASAQSVFDQLSGSLHVSQIGGQVESDLLFSSLMLSHLQPSVGSTTAGETRRVGEETSLWMSGFGRRAERDGNGLGSDMTDNSRGLAFGATTMLGDEWTFGVAGAIGTDHVTNDSGSGRSEADSYFLGLSAARDVGAFRVSLGGAYTFRSIDTTRSVALGTVNEELTAGYDARSLQAFGEVSTLIGQGDLHWQPFGNLVFVHYDSDGFAESGGTTALAGQGMSDSTLYSTLGLRLAWNVPVSGLENAAVTAHAGWRHAFGDDASDRRMAFLSGGDGFTVAGVKAAKDAVVLGLGVSMAPTQNSSLSIGYDGQFGDGTAAHGIKADWKLRF